TTQIRPGVAIHHVRANEFDCVHAYTDRLQDFADGDPASFSRRLVCRLDDRHGDHPVFRGDERRAVLETGMHKFSSHVRKGFHAQQRVVTIPYWHRGLELPIRLGAQTDLAVHVYGYDTGLPRQLGAESRDARPGFGPGQPRDDRVLHHRMCPTGEDHQQLTAIFDIYATVPASHPPHVLHGAH